MIYDDFAKREVPRSLLPYAKNMYCQWSVCISPPIGTCAVPGKVP